MKMMFKVLAIAAATGLSFGSAQAQQTCKKINVLKKVHAKLVPSLGGCESVAGLFDPAHWPLLGVCYVSDGMIPARIGGKSVELETFSAWVVPSSGLQQVLTLYKVHDGSGNEAGAIHSLDAIHPKENKEDLVFIGGSGPYSGSTGTATLAYTANVDPNSPLPVSIDLGRLKGTICAEAL